MPRASNDGVELAYTVEGPADAPVVTFVEGLGYAAWMWQWQRERLSDYRTIVWDNRGAGDSDKPEGPYTIEEMAEDMAAVLDDAGVESTHVVGASMGGMIAQRFAIEHGDRVDRLALLCTSHGGPDAVPTPEATQERMFGVPEAYDEREAIRYKMRPAMTEDFFEENDELIEQIIDWRLESDAPEDARLAQGAAVEAFDSAGELDAIDAPTLVCHGTDDRVLPVGNGRQVAERIPNAQLDLFEGGSHLFFLERPDAVTDAIRAFLAGER